MPRASVDFDTVRKLANELGEVEECTVHGAPSLKVCGKLFAWIPVHKSAEPGSLVVRIDADLRATLIASAPDLYYMTPHFVNYPTVLVRLSRIRTDALKELLGLASSIGHLKPVKRVDRKQKATRGGRKRRRLRYQDPSTPVPDHE
jgi:hypothetical protein